MGPDGGPVAAPPRCHGGGGPAEPPEEDVDSPPVSGASEVWPVWGVGVVWVVGVVGEPREVSVAGASVPGLSVLGAPLPDAVPDGPFGLPSSSTAGTRVVDSAGAASSVLVRAPPVPDV